MMQVIEQTHDEKIAMYMKSTKAELAEMLVGCNEALEIVQKARRNLVERTIAAGT